MMPEKPKPERLTFVVVACYSLRYVYCAVNAMTTDLRIPVETVKTAGLRIDKRIEEESLRPDGVEPLGLESVALTGFLQNLDGQYLFQGNVSAFLTGACVRCLEPASLPVEAEVTWLFEPGAQPASKDADALDDEEEELGPRVSRFSGNELDLGPMAWEELLLALPAKLVCRPKCAGLCPACGAPLTDEGCICGGKPAEGSGKFAALRDMFPDLPSSGEKE